MKSFFSSEFFAGNRTALLAQLADFDMIAVPAAGKLQRSQDTGYPFRQDSYFWYLTGVEECDAVLYITKNGESAIVLPLRNAYQNIFDGELSTAQIQKRSGVDNVYEYEEGWNIFEKNVKKSKKIHTTFAPPAYIERDGLYSNPSRRTLKNAIETINPGAKLIDIRPNLMNMRQVKQAPELLALQSAIDITVDSFLDISKRWHDFVYEYEVDAAMHYNFRKRGATGHAYAPIAGSGDKSCVLHYEKNKAKLKPGNIVLIDMGAEVENYAADITRCYSFGQQAMSGRQIQVHRAVEDVQDFALQQIKPGMTIRAYEEATESYMGEKLKELGLIKRGNKVTIRDYYPHATSHFLGLDVHDVGDYDKPLVPGMVLTCEPGIYIRRESLGIRIEDDVLVTENGCEVLSRRLPRVL